MEIVDRLRASKAKTLELFNLEAGDLSKSYKEGKWNIKEILNHLADAETVLYERLRRTIARPNQVIWSFDPGVWGEALNYKEFPLEINKEIYSSVRNSVIFLADKYYESHGNNQFVHSDMGLRTLKEEFDKIAWHNEHHLGHIEIALSN